MNNNYVELKKIDGVVFVPAVCGHCGKQLALIAIDPNKKHQRPSFVLNEAHNCPRYRQLELPHESKA